MHLQLDNPEPALIKEDGELITGSKVKACVDTVRQRQYQEKVEREKWQEKLLKNRWDENNLGEGGGMLHVATYAYGGRVTRTLSAATAYQGLPP